MERNTGKHISDDERGLLRDIGSRPFGVGAFPSYLLDFFNWGAFSQPLLWGIVYGVWPVVLVMLACEVLPYFLAASLFGVTAQAVRYSLYLLILELLFTSVARLFAGVSANRLVWKREARIVTRVRNGKPRWDFDRYYVRQYAWAKYGMMLYSAATVANAWLLGVSLSAGGHTARVIGTVLPIVWMGGTILGAARLAQGNALQVTRNGIVGSEERNAVVADTVTAPCSYDGPSVTLSDGSSVPALGFGTYKITDATEVHDAVVTALSEGYRHIDTASFYGNEEAVGAALRDANLPRDAYFLTSKVWQNQQGYLKTLFACEESMYKLGVDYLDLYLVHWPVASKMAETWKAMEQLLMSGKVRAIGVCNFEEPHLTKLLETALVAPAVNQIEMHPGFARSSLRAYCARNAIAVEAWAPLARGAVFEMPELKEIGARVGKTAGQVALRWAYQHGCVVLPKSVHAERIRENAALFDFTLSDAEMAAIDSLGEDDRIGPDPTTFSWEWPKSSRN